MWNDIIKLVNKMEEDLEVLPEQDEVTQKAIDLSLLMARTLRDVAIKEQHKRIVREKITRMAIMIVAGFGLMEILKRVLPMILG